MKTRSGFVSNSSSSSFCMVGAFVDSDTLRAYMESKGIDLSNVDDDYELAEVFNSRDNESKLNVGSVQAEYVPEEVGEGILIGRDPFSVGDDETGKQFRDSIAEVVERISPGAKVESVLEAYYS